MKSSDYIFELLKVVNRVPATTLKRKSTKHWSSAFLLANNSQTLPKLCQNNSMTSEIYYSDIVLKDKGGDITKPWYIEFYTIENGVKDRNRITGGFNRIKTRAERYKAAKSYITQLQTALAGGKALLHANKIEIEEPKSILPPAYLQLERLLASQKNILKNRTYTSYKAYIVHFKAFFKDKTFDEIKPRDADQFIDNLKILKKSTKTIYGIGSNLRHMIERIEEVDINPFKHLKLQNKTTGNASIPWTIQEFQQLQEFTKDKLKLTAYWGMIYYCAIRPDECSYLKKSNFNLDNSSLIVNQKETKNSKTMGVSIPKQFIPVLQKYFKQVNDKEYLFGRHISPSIEKTTGGRLSDDWKRQVKDKSDLKKNVYQLKHTAVVNMVKAGIDKTRIQHHLRHSSVVMTEKYLQSIEGYIFEDMKDNFPEY